MSSARKYANDRPSMSPESRNRSYAAINISWQKMRPDLHFESKEIIREEMLSWIVSFLQIKKLDSIKNLSDGQIGRVLDEMRNLSGEASEKKTDTKFKKNIKVAPSSGNVVNLAQFKRQHYATEEQKYTLGKIIDFLGWSEETLKNFLIKRKFGESIEKLAFKKANSLTMILLNSAAHKDLKAKGLKTGRAETAKHIKFIKRKLQIGD